MSSTRRMAWSLVLLASSLWGCERGPTTSADDPVPGPTMSVVSPTLSCASALAGSRRAGTLSFVHVADLHASYNPGDDGVSPYAFLAGYVAARRALNPATVFTDGGDDLEKGSLAELASRGAATRAIVHAMGFDVRTLGNHDFAWSAAETLAFARDPSATVVTSNVRYLGPEGAFQTVPSTVRNVGCWRVGFFGLIPEPYGADGRQQDDDYYPDFPTDNDTTEAARRIVDELRPRVDVLVLVSHLGLSADRALAHALPGIDVILGGHSHSTTPTPEQVGSTLIVHPGAHGKTVALLDLHLDPARGTLVGTDFALSPIDAGLAEPDSAVQAVVEAQLATWAPDALQAVGRLERPRKRFEIAEISARAAVAVLGVDAALVDRDLVDQPWNDLTVRRQALADTWTGMRAPPGSPGIDALYSAEVSGADLRALWSYADERWHVVVPFPLDEHATYTLALPKRAVADPSAGLPVVTTLVAPRLLCEAWELLDEWALRQRETAAAFDAELP